MTDKITPFPAPHTNPRAHSFDLWDCGEPHCGIHIISFDADGQVILETVMSPSQTLKLVHSCQDILFRKVKP